MSVGMMVYVDAYAGLLNIAASFIAYILVFRFHQITLTDIFNTATNSWVTDPNDLTLANGRVLGGDEQTQILAEVQSAYYFTIVACQFFHIWIVRNRFESFFKRSPFRNFYMNCGVLVEV